MKLVYLLPFIASGATATTKLPQRLTRTSLSSGSTDQLLLSALSRDGLVSITSIPDFAPLKHQVLKHFTDCLIDRDAVTVQFDDGTVRRSYAMTEGAAGELPATPACLAFGQSLVPFRSAVDSVVGAFARRLSLELASSLHRPLLTGRLEDEDLMWNDVEDVVSSASILDHFHSYQKVQDGEASTIEFHVDQGLFLAFAPGMLMDLDGIAGVSDGFYVKDASGEEYELLFDEGDDLVIMLGDGVNQLINNKIKDASTKALVATSHALKMKTHQDPSLSRAWFGRMILPPQDAFVSSSSSEDAQTFGQVRSNIIAHFSTNNQPMTGVGCSSTKHELGLHGASIARDLQECAEDELYCWFRCMPLADHELTVTTCSERNLQLQCANPRDQVVPDGMQHGDFFPACTNSSDPVTAYPLIEQQDNLTCPDLWNEFITMDDDYDYTVDITVPNGPETQLMWSITDENVIKARLVHDDVFGWLSIGFADPDGGHNGMNGGQVLIATPYGTEDYSPVTGLETSNEASIATYVIDSNDTAFRHWQEPLDTEEALATVASFDTNDCSTSLSFESSHINGKEFNVNGTDEMIWAANSADYFMGYHGPFSRLRFTIDWRSGVVTPFSAVSHDEESHVEGSHDDQADKTTVDINDIVSDLEATNDELSSDVKDNGSSSAIRVACFTSMLAIVGCMMFIL